MFSVVRMGSSFRATPHFFLFQRGGLFSVEEAHCLFAEVAGVCKDVARGDQRVSMVHQLAYSGNRYVTTCKFSRSRSSGGM